MQTSDFFLCITFSFKDNISCRLPSAFLSSQPSKTNAHCFGFPRPDMCSQKYFQAENQLQRSPCFLFPLTLRIMVLCCLFSYVCVFHIFYPVLCVISVIAARSEREIILKNKINQPYPKKITSEAKETETD